MTFGFALRLLSPILGFVGSVTWAFSVLFASASELVESTASKWGFNIEALEAEAQRTADTRTGLVVIALGFLVGIASELVAGIPLSQRVISTWVFLAVLVAVIASAWYVRSRFFHTLRRALTIPVLRNNLERIAKGNTVTESEIRTYERLAGVHPSDGEPASRLTALFAHAGLNLPDNVGSLVSPP